MEEPMDVQTEASEVADRAEYRQSIQDTLDLADHGANLATRLWYQFAATAIPEDMRRALVAQAMQEFWEGEFAHCHNEGSA